MAALAVAATVAAQDTAQPGVVEVKARTNPGDVPYAQVLRSQQQLDATMPPEPRLTDIGFRMRFVELSAAERDSYLPQQWAAAIVGKDVEHTVAVARGGYFTLPDLPQAQDATLMFNSQTRKHFIGISWRMRHTAGVALDYAALAGALDEVRRSQAAVPWYRFSLKTVRRARIDALKACFLTPGGRMQVAGARPAQRGDCTVIRFDPALLAANPALVFVGEVDRLTRVESMDW